MVDGACKISSINQSINQSPLMVDGACKISSINQSINQSPLMVDGACKISSINQSIMASRAANFVYLTLDFFLIFLPLLISDFDFLLCCNSLLSLLDSRAFWIHLSVSC